MRILILVLASIQSIAQIGTASVQNPLVRLGDNTEFSLEFPDGGSVIKNFVKGSITVSTEKLALGKHEVGPITFMIDGVPYSTNAVSFKIYPELPKDMRLGLWVSLLEEEGCIVLEQRIPAELKVERRSKSSVTFTPEAEGHVFAELNEEAFRSAGVAVFMRTATSSVAYAEPADLRTGYSYKTTVYSYEKLKTLKGSLTVTSTFYKDLPKGVKLDVIVIK